MNAATNNLDDAKTAILSTLHSLTKTVRAMHGPGTDPKARGRVMMEIAGCQAALAAICRASGSRVAWRHQAAAKNAACEAGQMESLYQCGEVLPCGFSSEYFRTPGGHPSHVYKTVCEADKA